MTPPLRWTPGPRATCFYAADAFRRRLPVTDPALAEALARPVGRLEEALGQAEADADAFWRAAAPLAVDIEENRPLAETVLKQTAVVCDNTAAERIAQGLGEVEAAVGRVWPRLADELRYRERPLREQWESRGPGLWRRLASMVDFPERAAEAEVVFVHPCLGGGGGAYPEYRRVCLEAVLANPSMLLPEPVRLGWLLAQLACEASGALGDLPTGRRRRVIALAAIPWVLEAAEYVEWTRCDRATIELALSAWRPPLPEGAEADAVAQQLDAWRRIAGEKPFPRSEAIHDLDRRLRRAA